MEFIARNFEPYPKSSPAALILSPLLEKCEDILFPFSISERNSNQITSHLDSHLRERLLSCGAAAGELRLPEQIKKQYDFAFAFSKKCIVVEVEKANSDKILYDFLKFHMYFTHGADFAMLFLPKNWTHAGPKPVNIFDLGVKRYQHCLEFKFGTTRIFERILLVGYQQFTRDGTLLTASVRREIITNIQSAASSQPILNRPNAR